MNAIGDNPENSYKILTIGDSGVGKTCLLMRFVENKFFSSHLATVGIDYKAKHITIDNNTIKLRIWDTAGQERFHNITQQYYKGADGILLVFDLSDKNTFYRLKNWLLQIQQHTRKVCIVLVGNKADKEREVSKEEALELAKINNLEYFETSALSNEGIKEVFENLARQLIIVKNVPEEGLKKSIKLKSNLFTSSTEEEKKCCFI